jgi:hypothetical protein
MGFEDALNLAQVPLREFMFSQTRESDLAMFAELGGYGAFASQDDVPLFRITTLVLNERAKDRVSNWFFIVCAVFGDRLGCCSGVDVDGHDDALPNYHFTAF